ncbi:NusG domain II-containing protein [Collinsella aerofaciens]|uniref:NusG domain II-containing protein n=1 Tax=Collinsella aerofaciens TaxID=74426 RepID=UPI00189A16AA|nr:NusG domain II-containing protein [Collinsella aerofaciens]MDB1829190.1 NusG domain II-containing protein [Collinsella aerofaciens]
MVKRKGARDGRDNKRLNLILVLAIAAAACVGLVATRLMGANTNADTATVVIRDGEQNVYELPLNQNTTKTVTTDLGTNLIEIKDGRVHVEEADCPNQDCVHQGWVDAAGEQIVCLPHKLTVDIVDESAKATYDVVGR